MPVRVATFNVENLLARFDFSGWRREMRRDRTLALVDIRSKDQFRALEQARVVAHADDTRQMTALALADTDADIVALQEVENAETLDAFCDNYLERMFALRYEERHVVEGNDTRGIDVALLARRTARDGTPIEVLQVRSNAHLTYDHLGLHDAELAAIGVEAGDRVFRRDLLEVDLRVGGRRATLYLAHFKSMGPWRDGVPGRTWTRPIRHAEAAAARAVIERRFGERTPDMRWLVLGDLNDYRERLVVTGSRLSGRSFEAVEDRPSGLEPLFDDGFSENLVARRPADDRWTLFHAGGPERDGGAPQERATQHCVQLDYILASPRVARANVDAVPDILRAGQPHRTPFPPGQTVERYPRTGWDRPKASDHCPVAVTLDFV